VEASGADETPVAAQPSTSAEVEPVPVAAAPVAAVPVAEPYRLPIEDLAELARTAGLEWINSDAGKVAAVQAAIAAEPTPVRVPRVIRPVVLVDEGPLVLVETRRDLADLQLPFERSEASVSA
jgi:ribonuclease E